MATQDHPVQILTYNKVIRAFELNNEVIERVLYDNDVRDCNIAIVSIAGAFRKGKSFLLGFFLRYLDAEYIQNNSVNWLGDDNAPLAGFAWRGGSNRHTTGIWIWSKIYTKELPNGEKIGVMLMDTQGTFDSNSTMKDNVTIFSLSTMLSSVQIYNLFHNLQEDDLQHLQLFTEYGKLAMQENPSAKAFQKLLFLIRDWSYPYEYNYGSIGGRALLGVKLEVTEDQDEELTYVRTHIKSFYDDLDCFLMPYPGNKAVRTRDFSGQLRDLDGDFKASLMELVPLLLAPNNVLTKKVNGVKIKAKNLLSYIEIYWEVFKKGESINAKTILGATSEANNLSAKEEANDYYDSKMRQHTAPDQPILEVTALIQLHESELSEAINIFRARAVMGDENMKTKYLQKLKSEVEKQLIMYIGQNELKHKKNMEETINNLSSQINSYEVISSQQTELIQTLQNQMEDFNKSSAEEKQRLLNDLESLRNQPPPQVHRKKKKCTIS